LRLDGQQPPSELVGAARRVAIEQLCRASLRGYRLIIEARGLCRSRIRRVALTF